MPVNTSVSIKNGYNPSCRVSIKRGYDPSCRVTETAPAIPTYLQKLYALFGSSIVALWPQNEQSGTVSKDISGRGHDGAYTGVTLGQPGIGDGNTAASFDGTTSRNNVYSTGLNTDFVGAEGTFLIWAKVANAGVWTDATARRLVTIGVDASNFFALIKQTGNNRIDLIYDSGGATKTVIDTGFSGVIDFFCLALTWSKTQDKVIAYKNGTQDGSTQTGLNTWVGSLLSTACVIGAASTTPTNVWSGSIGPVLLLNRAATAAEIAIASVVP